MHEGSFLQKRCGAPLQRCVNGETEPGRRSDGKTRESAPSLDLFLSSVDGASQASERNRGICEFPPPVCRPRFHFRAHGSAPSPPPVG